MIDVHGRESIDVHENQQELERHVAGRYRWKMVRERHLRAFGPVVMASQ
jgi:hypothetical protein